MAIEHIKIDQIGEDKVSRPLLQETNRSIDARVVVLGVVDDGNASVAEDVLNLAYTDDIFPMLDQRIQHGIGKRFHRVVLAVFGALVCAARSFKRAGDHAADEIMIVVEQFARNLADAVEFRQRDHAFVRRDLEHAVRGGIDDGFAGLHVLVTQAGDDLRSACDFVSDGTASDLRFKLA